MKLLEIVAYLAWGATIPFAISAAKTLGVWHQDVFVNGVSAGILVAVVFHKIERWLNAYQEQHRTY